MCRHDSRIPDTAWIGLLLIFEAHQNKGYGVLALKMLTDIARGWQQERIQLSAISTNLKALSFWRRESFVELRRVPNTQFLGDAVLMEWQFAQEF